MKTEKTRHHLRILRDKARFDSTGKGLLPIGCVTVGGITFHAVTAATFGDKLSYVEGQFVPLSATEVESIKRALAVTRDPVQVLDKLERRLVQTPEGSVEREVPVYRQAPHGRGLVVQWSGEKIEKSPFSAERIEWSSRVIDRSDPRYMPTANHDDEAPLSDYLSVVPAPHVDQDPPPLDMSGIKAVGDDEARGAPFAPKIPDPLGVRSEAAAVEAAPPPAPVKRKG